MMKARHFRIAFQKLRNSRFTTIINTIGLSIGIAAFIIACPLAYYGLQKWLDTFAERTAISWWIYIISEISVLVITILTVSIQSWKTAARNPVESLRYE